MTSHGSHTVSFQQLHHSIPSSGRFTSYNTISTNLGSPSSVYLRMCISGLEFMPWCCALQSPDIAIHHSEEVLHRMNAWSLVHHQRSGLTQKCRDSTVTIQVSFPPSPPHHRHTPIFPYILLLLALGHYCLFPLSVYMPFTSKSCFNARFAIRSLL